MDKLQLTKDVKNLLTQFCKGNAIGYKYIETLKKNKEFNRFISGQTYKHFFNVGIIEYLRIFYKSLSIDDLTLTVQKDSNGKDELVIVYWEYKYDEYVRYTELLHDIYFLKEDDIHKAIDEILIKSIEAHKKAEAEYALEEEKRKKAAAQYEFELYKKLKKKFEKNK